jgi:YVTN family beta-propeller protein
MTRGGPALAVTARVRTGSLPKSVETSPDGRFVVVCNFGRLDEDNLWVYDATTLDVVARVSVRGNPVETLFTADASTLYVSSFKTHEVHELDVATWTVRRSIPVGKNPKVMALSRDEQRLFVANWTTNTISVIDRASGTTLHELPTLEHPRGLAIRSDGVVITAAMYDHTIHVFAPEGDGYRERTRFTACQYPRHFALVPDESLLVISCSGTDSVQWWDVDAGKRRGYARAGDNPRSMAMDRSGRWVAVANFRSSDVTLIDLHAGTWANHAAPETDRIVGIALQPPAPGDPPGVPATPPRVFATSWGNNQLLVLEPR